MGGNITNSFGAVGSFVNSLSSVFVGSGIFNPGTAPTASTTYVNSLETIVGANSGTCFYSSKGNTLIGTSVADHTSTNCSTLPTATENVFITPGYYGAGNAFLQNITSGVANFVISGQGFGGSAPVGGNISAGAGNVILGGGSGSQVLATNQSTLIGNEAGAVETAGSITSVGAASFQALTSGTADTAVGFTACQLATTASNMTCIGDSAGKNETTAGTSTYVGSSAGKRPNATSGSNVAIGSQAASVASGSTGSEAFDVAIGQNSNWFGSNDTAIGQNAI